jgi:hypothetical protein
MGLVIVLIVSSEFIIKKSKNKRKEESEKTHQPQVEFFGEVYYFERISL